MSNEYAPTPPPPPPVFNINPTPYTWVKPASSNVTRIPPRKPDIERERERPRDYKFVARSSIVSLRVKSCNLKLLINLIHNFFVAGKVCFTFLQRRLEFWYKVEVSLCDDVIKFMI